MVTFANIRRRLRNGTSGACWRPLCYLPDVDVFYKEERKNKSGKNTGVNIRNWLKCLNVGIQDIIEIHQSDTASVKLTVTIGDETHEVTAYIPMSVILGDNKSQDTLCGFIHCTQITDGVLATRGCKTLLSDASDTTLACQFVTEKEVIRLHDTAIQRNRPSLLKERLYRNFVPENPLFKLDYGDNIHGCNTAASVDPLHSNKGGLIKYTTTSYVIKPVNPENHLIFHHAETFKISTHLHPESIQELI